MSALLPQIIEPAGNVVRLGAEAASQLQRKASAAVLFANPSGVSNTIAPNVPAIPWTSGTGFGSGVSAPTTAGTVDLTDFAGRWVTFLLAGANLSTQPMYVCKVTDWPAIAGPAGGRTVIPLDVWELHSWHYCGREFAVGLDLLQHGTYTFTTTDIPANTDTATVTRTYPLPYAAGVTPDVLASSHDVGWIASAAPTSGNEQTQIDISLSRRIPLTNPQTGTVSLTFPSGASSYAYPSNPVTFPGAYDSSVTPTPVVIPQTNHADFVAVASGITTTGFTLTIYYRPNLSSGSVGAPSPDQSGDNATDSTGMHGVGTGSPVSPIETQLAYSKVAGANGSGGDGTSGASGTGASGAGSAGHHHTLGAHTHPFTGATTLTGSSVALTIVWESFGQRAAPAVSKLCSWMAVGLGAS
jgi:hypothetical protein